MIPIKLQVQNFMAYKAAETLNFTDIHVACLSGENGAGKSSLLDAITWSLWGKARVSQNDSLIHLGEVDMEVEFSFALGEETYRILRRRTTTRRGKTELHFHIADVGGWRTLTESSMRKTQAKIDRLLRLDYDTFVNSAFILQGRADEFTNKTPRERKQILADILGLGIYDEYEERAREQVRHYQQEIKVVEAQIESIEQELAREADYRAELEASQGRAAQLRHELGEMDGQLTDLRQRYQTLEHQRAQAEDLQSRLEQAQVDIEELSQVVTETEEKIKRHQAISEQKAEIEAGHRTLEEAQAALADWTQRLAKSNTLWRDKHRLETVINQARIKLETNIQNGEARLAELSPKVEAIPALETGLVDLDRELQALQALEQERDEDRQQLETMVNEAADLKAKNDQLKVEMETINNRLTQLKEAGAACPVCTQPLTDDHRTQVYEQFMRDGKTRGDAYRNNRARQTELQSEQEGLQKKLKQAERTLKRASALQSQKATKEQVLNEAKQAQSALAEQEAQLAAWRQQLADQAFEVETAAELAGVEAALVKVGYDEQAHQAAQDRVEALAHFAEDLRQLADAQTRLAEEQARLQREQARHTRLLEQTATDQAQIKRLMAEIEALPEVSAELTKTSRELDRLQREERLARNAVGAAEQKLNHVAHQAKERGKKEEKLVDLKEMLGIYQELRTAFGKNGVQALIIENTIPELEDEANNILSRMTDGRMHLQFITQRETKSGQSLIETLDIRIADEVGTRDYELYSGGEAFRVNFAIRIALSKLLARRSGAKLQTLVIDEGFGTQDTQGRERLIEAINKIQNEFEKIIVITHIDEIKEAFPTQIMIQKGPNGSVILVN